MLETMEYETARFTGQPVARCRECGYTSIYWEDEDDLIHDCDPEE